MATAASSLLAEEVLFLFLVLFLLSFSPTKSFLFSSPSSIFLQPESRDDDEKVLCVWLSTHRPLGKLTRSV